MRRKLLWPLLLLCLVLLAGCTNLDQQEGPTPIDPPQDDTSRDEPAPEPKGLRAFSLPYFPSQTLDPITCPDGPHQTIAALLYEGLYALDEHFELHPMLAQSCTYDPDTFVYGITLRSGVLFSDGSPLTAADVAASLERARYAERYAGRLADIVSVKAVGSAVYVALARPNANFMARLDIPIVKAGTEHNAVPIGTGRYVWQEDGESALLAVNEGNWRHLQLPVEQIPLVPCKDNDAMAYAFFSREIQLLAWDLTGTVAINVSGANSYTDAPTAVMQYVGFNTNSPLFSDPALRAAVSLGIDRERCVNACLLGHGEAASFPVSPASSLYPQDLVRPYSAEDYAAAMEAAGYQSGTEKTATMIVSAENTFRTDMARQIAEGLSQYDVKITVVPLPWAEFQSALATGNYDLYYGECKLTADWDLTALLAERGALNFSGYTDEELPDLLYTALTTPAGRRSTALKPLFTYLQQQAPFVPVCFKNVSVLLPEKGVEMVSPTAVDPFFHLTEWNIQWVEEAS